MTICSRCRNPIAGNVIHALGKSWHKHCFRCQKCKLPIQTRNFIVLKNHAYHLHCIKCASCKKRIDQQFIDYNNDIWHVECYKKVIGYFCSVCGELLQRKYYQDFWGNKFCASHINHSKCLSCGRIVCERLTRGGITYPDGLLVCNLCNETAVTTLTQAIRIVEEMRLELQTLGLGLANTSVPVRLVDREELRSRSRHNFHNERPILGLACWSKSVLKGRVVARQFENILVQKNLPEAHFRTVIIHELTHAWFFYGYYENPLIIEEGMCVLMEYLWLKKQKTQDAAYRLELITQSKDPIYGEGFRQALLSRKRLPLKMLMRYIKEKKKFPSALAAFFYY